MTKFASIICLLCWFSMFVGAFIPDDWVSVFIIGISILVLDIMSVMRCFPKDDLSDPRHWSHHPSQRVMHYFFCTGFWIIGIVVPVICLIHWFFGKF